MPTALITGASSGIGMELAKCFATDHHNVILVARRKEKLEQLAYDLREIHGVRAHVFACDLGQPGAARELYEQLKAEDLEVDFLVNNAGIGQNGKFHELDAGQMSTMLHLNVTALTELTRYFLPEMIERNKGKILNVGSTAGFQPGPHMAVYYATKAYVYSFTEALAEELKDTRITITNLAPGATDSEFKERADMNGTVLFAMGAMSPEEVAKAGYKAMLRGKSLVIPGLKNKLIPVGANILPRKVMRKIVHRVNRDK